MIFQNGMPFFNVILFNVRVPSQCTGSTMCPIVVLSLWFISFGNVLADTVIHFFNSSSCPCNVDPLTIQFYIV